MFTGDTSEREPFAAHIHSSARSLRCYLKSKMQSQSTQFNRDRSDKLSSTARSNVKTLEVSVNSFDGRMCHASFGMQSIILFFLSTFCTVPRGMGLR
ncbi:hypothetical protein M405DRAFT_92406 [Rhizopogon salebrosus TDB-379]|nr:hypothetical protein M405DRAFT_92406 [Rhizopogon salebrosus TDB-379]